MPLNNVKLPAPKNAEALSGQEWGEWERTVFTDPVDPTISFLEGYSELTENLQAFILNEDNKLTSIKIRSIISKPNFIITSNCIFKINIAPKSKLPSALRYRSR